MAQKPHYQANRKYQHTHNTTNRQLFGTQNLQSNDPAGNIHIEHIKAGVHQGAVLSPVLYNLVTSDISNNTLLTCADNTAILSLPVTATYQPNTSKMH